MQQLSASLGLRNSQAAQYIDSLFYPFDSCHPHVSMVHLDGDSEYRLGDADETGVSKDPRRCGSSSVIYPRACSPVGTKTNSQPTTSWFEPKRMSLGNILAWLTDLNAGRISRENTTPHPSRHQSSLCWLTRTAPPFQNSLNPGLRAAGGHEVHPPVVDDLVDPQRSSQGVVGGGARDERRAAFLGQLHSHRAHRAASSQYQHSVPTLDVCRLWKARISKGGARRSVRCRRMIAHKRAGLATSQPCWVEEPELDRAEMGWLNGPHNLVVGVGCSIPCCGKSPPHCRRSTCRSVSTPTKLSSRKIVSHARSYEKDKHHWRPTVRNAPSFRNTAMGRYEAHKALPPGSSKGNTNRTRSQRSSSQ